MDNLNQILEEDIVFKNIRCILQISGTYRARVCVCVCVCIFHYIKLSSIPIPFVSHLSLSPITARMN